MSNTPYPYTMTAIERDGLDLRVLTMNFDILQENLDLRSAIRMAVAEYLQTEDGEQRKRTRQENHLYELVLQRRRSECICGRHQKCMTHNALGGTDLHCYYKCRVFYKRRKNNGNHHH